jgi:hypothetical protein
MRPVFNNFSSGHKKKHYFLSVPERLETSDIAHFSCFITALYLICNKLRFWDLYTKKADFIEKSALFCFQRRGRNSCFGKRLRRLRTPARVFSSPLIQKRKPDSFLFLAEREGLWPNFCSVLTLFICASNCE